jgi:small subunit ribosomal protein S16
LQTDDFLLLSFHMLRIRLARVGRKHDPSFRMIVTEKSRGPQTGNYVEQVGTYNARGDQAPELKPDRIAHWLSVGAQPSDTVHNLLVRAEIIDDDTVNPLPKKTPIVSDEAEESTGEGAPEANTEAATDEPTEAAETTGDDSPKSETDTVGDDSEAAEEDEPEKEDDSSDGESEEADEDDKAETTSK